MKFGFEQRWTASVEDVVDLYCDEAFWSTVSGFTKTSPPEVLEITRNGDSAFTRLRWKLVVDLPSQASRFIDPDNVAWVEETTWNLPAATATVGFVPSQGAALLKAKAEIAVVADGSEAVRRVTGELNVRIPLLGGKVEHAIADGIGDHLTEEADVVAPKLEG
ncbi:MAG: DUF2505 domain-containing protein [Microthrixaceae bacterium]